MKKKGQQSREDREIQDLNGALRHIPLSALTWMGTFVLHVRERNL